MSNNTTLHPGILWAQRADTVLLTLDLPDIKDEKYTLDDKKFQFSGKGGPNQHDYSVELEFFGEVVPQESKQKKTGRGIFLVIKKKESGPYWPRLLATKTKMSYVRTDFSRWKDEDDSGSEAEDPSNDNDLSKLMQQMGGMGGMGGMGMGGMGMGGGPELGSVNDLESSSDSDDQELPDLES